MNQMDIGLTEAMKNIVPKGLSADINSAFSGYVTEKLYMLLQLYLQNKGWNSIELLKIFSEMKDSSVLPSASYLQLVLLCCHIIFTFLCIVLFF